MKIEVVRKVTSTRGTIFYGRKNGKILVGTITNSQSETMKKTLQYIKEKHLCYSNKDKYFF